MTDAEQASIGEFTDVGRARRRIERIQHRGQAAVVGGESS